MVGPHPTPGGEPTVRLSIGCRVADHTHVDRKGDRESWHWKEDTVKWESERDYQPVLAPDDSCPASILPEAWQPLCSIKKHVCYIKNHCSLCIIPAFYVSIPDTLSLHLDCLSLSQGSSISLTSGSFFISISNCSPWWRSLAQRRWFKCQLNK